MEDLNRLDLPELFGGLVHGELLNRVLDLAIEEDAPPNGPGDVTSESIIAADAQGRAVLTTRQSGVVAGLEIVPLILARLGGGTCARAVDDGEIVPARSIIAVIDAPLRTILKAERIILNFIGRLSGIATLTRQYVDAVAGTGAVICETRKTTPGHRLLEKYAARCGGATLHRIGLHDAALYKDNHLAHLALSQWTQALTDAAKRVRASNDVRFIEVEVDTLEQLAQVLAIEPGLIDYVLLDNMPRDVLRQAVRMRDEAASTNASGHGVSDVPRLQLEASGGITLSNVRAIAETGVDRVSVGAITHSAPVLDVGLDIGP